jgi:transcriptional regulator with XRE-family HTH domain
MKDEGRDAKISRKIKQVIEELGLTPNAVAKKAGIDNANLYRLLRNERQWRFEHLEKICGALGISFQDLFDGTVHIPVVATISALESFRYPDVIPETVNYINYQGRSEGKMELYALEVGDRSFLPGFQAGTRFVAEKNSAGSIHEGAMVICPDADGGAQVCRVYMTEIQITLRSFNPTVPDRVLPKSHLKLCDKVVLIYPT